MTRLFNTLYYVSIYFMFFSNLIISKKHFQMRLRGDDVCSAPKLCSAKITSSALCIVPNISSVPKMKYVGFPTKSPESKHGMRFTYRRGVGEIVKLASSFQVHLYTLETVKLERLLFRHTRMNA